MNALKFYRLLFCLTFLFAIAWGCSPTTQVCTKDGDCLQGQRCDVDAGSCTTVTSCKTSNDCKVKEACTSGACQSAQCNPACKSNEVCKHGKCEKKAGACERNEDCPTGEGCKKGMCTKVECRNNVDCEVGKSCKDFKCVAGGSVPKIGERCDLSKGDKACEEGAVCWGISNTAKERPTCHKNCRNEYYKNTKICGVGQACMQVYRKINGKNVWIYPCTRIAKENEPCSLARGIACAYNQWPPLFCSSKGLCQKANLAQKGEDCDLTTYKSSNPKICDRTKGLACNRTTKKCQQAKTGKLFDTCDNETVLCQKGMYCSKYYLGGKAIGAHCLRACKPLTENRATDDTTSCKADETCIKLILRNPLRRYYVRNLHMGVCSPHGKRKMGEVCKFWEKGEPARDPSLKCNSKMYGIFNVCVVGWPGTTKGVCQLRFSSEADCRKKCTDGICNNSSDGKSFLCGVACSSFVGCKNKDTQCYELEGGTNVCGPKPDK